MGGGKMKRIVVVLILFNSINLFAITKQDIDRIEREVNALSGIVKKHYDIIKSNRIESVENILEKYSGAKSTLIKKWFNIAIQSQNRPSLMRFVTLSKRKIKFYLDQMLLDSNNPMSQKDYKLITQKIMSLGEDSYDAYKSLNYNYITKTAVNLRNLPIFLKITKHSVLKQGEKIKLIYDISYQIDSGEISRWGFFEVERNGQKGWINLKNTRRVY
jgi:hypothetical protein